MKTLLTLQLTIFILVAVGFLIKKIHIIGPQGQKNINDLVIYLILPCNILHAFTQSAADEDFSNYLAILFISIGIQIFCVIYGKVMFRKESEDRRKCLQYGTICSNAGFLGNPIAEGVYGMEGLILASVYLIPQRIMMWSSGLAVFSGSSDKMKTVKKVVTHPCILACVLGILLMITGLPIPPGLDGAVTAVGNCNTAMSMMVIGMILADINFKDFWDWTVVKYTIHRLVIIPAVVYIVCGFLPLSKNVLGLCVLLAAMPAGATTSILAEKYQVDSPFAYKTGDLFHAAVTSDYLPVEYFSSVNKQNSSKKSPPPACGEGFFFIYFKIFMLGEFAFYP